eukprot:GILI01059167.1.p1 GENE.GILI01059167.1~~GILI01059167.1.p1  ORF type:complete len:150 (-),score=16.13 GILI01059167.1:19-468(-)
MRLSEYAILNKAVRHNQLNTLFILTENGSIERRGPIFICEIRICPIGKQKLYARRSKVHSVVKDRTAIAVCDIHISPVGKKQLNAGCVAELRGFGERRAIIITSRIHICPFCNQQSTVAALSSKTWYRASMGLMYRSSFDLSLDIKCLL